MKSANINRILSVIWAVVFYSLLMIFFGVGHTGELILWIGLGLILIFSLSGLVLNEGKLLKSIDIVVLYIAYTLMIAIFLIEILITNSYGLTPLILYPLLAFTLILELVNVSSIIENAFPVLLTPPVLILSLGAKFLVGLIDIIFPKGFQKLVPYIEVTREMLLSFTQIFASATRLETEQALDSLGDVSGRVDEIAEGYALRKGLGQGIDLGLTFIVFVVFGVLQVMQEDLRIPPQVILALFASLGLALSTFAGLFGPFYGLAAKCKEFVLKHGNYRGAVVYKALEQMFSIPFMAASAGFLFLDLPPIDSDTLEDFKGEMQTQITEITDNISALVGSDSGAVPRKTRKMIEELMDNTEQSLAKLDFRNIRRETNREFALTYYQHEFSWKVWKRKSAVAEFAENIHFDLRGGEDTLKLIGFKIEAGQMDDDMVSNVMVSAALRGVIMMEQKYQEIFQDTELGQTCTGLAFGARQFLQDHYVVRKRHIDIMLRMKNFLLGVFAIPIVLIISMHEYANSIFDAISESLTDLIIERRVVDITRIRTKEIYSGLIDALKFKRKEKKEKRKTSEEKAQRSWQIRRRIRKLFSMVWEVIIFPFMIILNIFKWSYKLVSRKETSARELFEEAVSHAALVAMYTELYNKLVMQTHLSTAY